MKTVRVLMLGVAAALGACHGDSGTPAPPTPTAHVRAPVAARKGPTAGELTAGMVEAVSQGKSQLPVQLKFDLAQRPTLGQVLDINLAIIPQIDASAAAIDVAAGDGLTVAAQANPIEAPAIEAGQVYHRSIKVTPTAGGVLVLSLSVSLKHDEMTESRPFSIPLIVER